MNWIFYGFKGVGKTTLINELRCLKQDQFNFLDTDEIIETAYHKSVRTLFLEYGQIGFSKIEEEIISKIQGTHLVIAVGGGTLMHPPNVELLKRLGNLIHLKEDKKKIQDRLLIPPLPPYIDPKNPIDSFEKIYSQRMVQYESLSSFQIQVGNRSPAQLRKLIWQVINSDKSFASQHGESPTDLPSAL